VADTHRSTCLQPWRNSYCYNRFSSTKPSTPGLETPHPLILNSEPSTHSTIDFFPAILILTPRLSVHQKRRYELDSTFMELHQRAAAGAVTATSRADFINTFILSSKSDSKLVLSEIPNAIDPSRQRRVHQKSRTGCESCRQRRVKVSFP
jgi:hypothetical protein